MFVVIITTPDKETQVCGVFKSRDEARVWAQSHHDEAIENGGGWKYNVQQLNFV